MYNWENIYFVKSNKNVIKLFVYYFLYVYVLIYKILM